ncbi:hypothetical protein KDW40_01920 [Burkholderia cenocepacia]|uniref:hypothetical protein n=1 Tax=Burkholderia TaxID=32008 RepID=UPI0005C45350|nr:MULTISPECIES: hypothetical protein [Burkholderia]MBR8043143.1 hypothetical protein [Burkholderia cenocepacia]MBR8324487.1 hypothetical protein [Burkholderia cenocepacia]
MARPRSVSAKVLQYFIAHDDANLSVADLMAVLTEFSASQIAHSLSALLVSGEIQHDGKRRAAVMPDGRTSRIQFYRVNPEVVIQHKEKDAMCSELGIDAERLAEMPFDVTPALSTFFRIQQALRGGARFESARAQRYGSQPQPAQHVGTGASLGGQLDFGFGLSV